VEEMLRRFLKNRRGTAEIIGSALFIVIILFFFSNVYLWHDQATRVMNNVLLERMNASVSMVATDGGVNVTNNGGVTFALSRLWIVDDNVSQHYYADLENILGHRISVDAGQSVQIDLDSTALAATGSPIPVTWNDTLNCPIVQYAPPEHSIILRILTELGNTASCVVRARALRPNIALSAAGSPPWPVATLVTLNGSNFEPASLITVKYDGITVPTYPPQAQTNGSGAFLDVLFNIPTSAFGNHILTVTDNGGSSANATLNVTPSLTVAPTRGSNGTSVTLSGNGFAANSTITIDTEMVASTSPDPLTTTVTGSFTASFIVPPNTHASDYTVTATDAKSNSASGTFTVVG
jgi:archaellum component FlaF (FlaF/FlaG flagellin family)